MSSLTFAIITGIIAAVQCVLEVFFDKYKLGIKAAKTISVILVCSAFYSAHLTAQENYQAESKAKDELYKRVILENQVLNLEKDLRSVNSDLTEEKNRIKSIGLKIFVRATGPWATGSEPYSSNIIPLPIQDMAIVHAFPKHGTPRSILSFFPSSHYYFIPFQNEFIFNSNLALRGDANILGAQKKDFFLFDRYRIAIPLVRWQQFPNPVTITQTTFEITINDTETYKVEYPSNLVMFPSPQSRDFADKSSSFLIFEVTVKKKDFKITYLKR